MGAIRRVIVDPETESDVVVTEAPFERLGGGVSRRLKAWIFETADGRYLCGVPMHRSVSLRRAREHEVEEVYLLGLRSR
jgi:hypothetical protein